MKNIGAIFISFVLTLILGDLGNIDEFTDISISGNHYDSNLSNSHVKGKHFNQDTRAKNKYKNPAITIKQPSAVVSTVSKNKKQEDYKQYLSTLEIKEHKNFYYQNSEASLSMKRVLDPLFHYPNIIIEAKKIPGKKPNIRYYIANQSYIQIKADHDIYDSSQWFMEHNIKIVRKMNEHAYLLEWNDPSIEARLDHLKLLENQENVQPVGVNHLIFASENTAPTDDLFNRQWYHHQASDIDVDTQESWNYNTDCREVPVAILDTGIDVDHYDLVDNIDFELAQDMTGSGTVNDQHSHGTHVAGTIAAMGNNGIGVSGVCWSAKLVPVKVLNYKGVGSSDWMISGINYISLETNVKIINASLGSTSSSLLEYASILNFNHSGGILVAAAGNENSNNDVTKYYPASYESEQIISVASFDHLNKLSDFSNYGEHQVNIAAPGSSILSTIPTGSLFGFMNGTSMATPLVSGAIALGWSMKKEATSEEVIQSLYKSAEKVDGNKPIEKSRRLNIMAFIEDLIDIDQKISAKYQFYFDTEIKDNIVTDIKGKIQNGDVKYWLIDDYFVSREDFISNLEAKIISVIGEASDELKQSWLESLSLGISLKDTVLTYLESEAYKELIRSKLHKLYLEEKDDRLTIWLEKALQGEGYQQLFESEITSESFLGFLNSAHMQIYGEENTLDPEKWLSEYRKGLSSEQVKTNFLNSAEWKQTINSSFTMIVGTYEGIDSDVWKNKINQGKNLNELREEFIASEFVTESYKNLFFGLTRLEATTVQLDRWKQDLKSKKKTFDGIKKDIINSRRTEIILNQFMNFYQGRDLRFDEITLLKKSLIEAPQITNVKDQIEQGL